MSTIEDLRVARKGVENCIYGATKAKTPRGGMTIPPLAQMDICPPKKRYAKQHHNNEILGKTQQAEIQPTDSHLLDVFSIYDDFKLLGCSVVPHLHERFF